MSDPQSLHFNPCCCIPLKLGVVVLSVFDMLHGVLYLFRVAHLRFLRKKYADYYPQPFPRPTQSDFMDLMFEKGNFIVAMISGLFLILVTQYLKNNHLWLSTCCYFWMGVRFLLVISLTIFCNALILSEYSHFVRFGFELMITIFLHLYFLVTVAVYLREARIDLNNSRAIKPLNIDVEEHHAFFLSEKSDIFNNSTAYHILTPQFFLNTKTHTETALLTDQSFLQYIVPRSMVAVQSELRSMSYSKSQKSIDATGARDVGGKPKEISGNPPEMEISSTVLKSDTSVAATSVTSSESLGSLQPRNQGFTKSLGNVLKGLPRE